MFAESSKDILKAVCDLLARSTSTLEALLIIAPYIHPLDLPAMPNLRHLYIAVRDLEMVPMEWKSKQHLRTLSVNRMQFHTRETSARAAAFVDAHRKDGLLVEVCEEPKGALHDYAWNRAPFDPIIGISCKADFLHSG